MTPGAPLAISVLGEVAATRADLPVDLGGLKQRAVLALLVLARGDVVPADRLVDSLWGEDQPRNGTGALHSYLSHLRKRLDPQRDARAREGLIVRQGPGYALRVASDTVDAWRFEQLLERAGTVPAGSSRVAVLREALGLWRGPAYADFGGAPWVEAEVGRLEGLRDHAREQLLAARLDAGEDAAVVPELEQLVAQDVLREERWRLLVLALYRAGRQADALAALRRARTTLADELGVDPGPALRELEAEVLAQSPALDAARPRRSEPAPAEVAEPRRAAPVPTTRPPADVLVGRDEELAELAAATADAWSGSGRLVLVEGPAGIGKSRLLAEARRRAADEGAASLAARGSQLEQQFAFGVVRQLFEPAVSEPTRRAALFSGAAAAAAGIFDTESPLDPADGSFSALHGLYWLTVNLAADGPVLLAVDDLQWCDTDSLRFLSYLVRRLEGLPVLVVATLRTGELHDHEALLVELVDDVATVPLRPRPLDLAAVLDLVAERLGEPVDEEFVAACHRTTSGNPLLLRQLLRALQTDRVRPDAAHTDAVMAIGSRAVSSMVLMRLARLPRAALDAARAVAVLGDGAELPDVASLAGLSEDEAAGAVATLSRAEVLRADYPLAFVHPLIRDAVYRDVPPGEREMAHQRAATALAQGGAAPEQIAAHLLQVPRRGDSWTVDVLRSAASTALRRGSADSAVSYLERALSEPPAAQQRPVVLTELGRVEVTSDGPAALRHLREAYDLLDDDTARATVALGLARTLVFAGAAGEATAFARAARARLPEQLVDESLGLLAIERIAAFMHGLPASEWQQGPVPAVTGRGPGARMLAAETAWELLIAGRDRERCIELSHFALEDGTLLHEDSGLFWVVAAIVLELSDQDISQFWDAALAHAYAQGSLFASLSVHLWRGYMLWRRGQLREALESLRTANEQSRMWGSPDLGISYGEAFAIGVLLDQGETEAARALMESVEAHPRVGDGARLFGEAVAKVFYQEGQPAPALDALDRVADLMTMVENPCWRPWRSLRSHPLHGLGRTDEAVALLEEELRLVRAWGSPSTVGRTLRMLAEMRSDPVVAQAELTESIALLTGTRARLQLARAHHALGRVLAPSAESVAHLTQALDEARYCGAHGMVTEVEAELLAQGAVVPPAVEAQALTLAERAMADRAAAGDDVRTIAQALFVTPGTVEHTLDGLCRRLGVSSPRALAEVLERG